MKKLLYTIAIMAVVTGIYFLVNKNLNSSGNFNPKLFAVTETQSIDKIFFSQNAGKQYILLEKQPDGTWLLNKKWPAAQQKVLDLINNPISKAEVRNPVNKENIKTIQNQIQTMGYKVEVYKNNTLAKTYFVGGSTSNLLGTYYSMPDEDPVIVEMPGFNGYLTEFFTTNTINWRSKLIFNFKQVTIEKIEVKHSPNSNDNFYITQNKNDVQLHGNGPLNFTPNANLVKSYLGLFDGLHFEGWPNLPQNLMDSIKSTLPFVSFTLTGNGGKTRKLVLWHKPVTDESRAIINRETGKPTPYDLEYYWGMIDDNGEILQVQDYTIGKRIVRLSDFASR